MCNFYFAKTTSGKKQLLEPHHYESSSTPSEGIIAKAIARGLSEVNVTDKKRAEAEGKGEG